VCSSDLSPALHNWAFRSTGLPGVYLAWDILPERLGDFAAAVRTLPISGVSVTIPHKQAVMLLLDGVTDLAKAVGAVNTLYWDGQGRLMGDNTDIAGFLAPLRKLERVPRSALVLGAGGAARAVVAGLRHLGVPTILLSNRTATKARDLALELSVEAVPWEDRGTTRAELVVNTTPLGMKGAHQDASPWADVCLSPSQTAYDLVYTPTRTRFLNEAENMGCRTIDGLSMFLHQAAAQFTRWTGRGFDLDAGRRLLEKLLE